MICCGFYLVSITDVIGYRSNERKKYFLFFLLGYIEALDKDNSVYNISHDIEPGLPDTPETRGLDKTYYDKIERFEIKRYLGNDLFYCQEISKPVCSRSFKEEFQSLGLNSINFQIIDENFKYAHWAGW